MTRIQTAQNRDYRKYREPCKDCGLPHCMCKEVCWVCRHVYLDHRRPKLSCPTVFCLPPASSQKYGKPGDS